MAHITGKSFTLAHLEEGLWGLATTATTEIGGTQFVYLTNNNTGGRLRIFSAEENGSLSLLGSISDTSEYALEGGRETELFTIGETTFLAAVGQDDDGLSVFEVTATEPYLVHTDTAFDSDDASYELNGVRNLAVHQIGGNTYLTAMSRPWYKDSTGDTGISVFSVDENGLLSLASVYVPDSGASIRSGWPSDTFEVNGRYFFAVGDPYGRNSFSIMEIDPETGTLTAAVPTAALFQPNFISTQISVHTTEGGVPYLFVPSDSDAMLYVYTYQGGADVAPVASIELTIPDPNFDFQAEVSTVYEAGDSVIVAVGSRGSKQGVLLFEFNPSSEALTQLEWLPGPNSTVADPLPLFDMTFGGDFTLDGQPYALISSENDNALTVWAIGGGDDVLVGTADADLIEGFGGNDTLTGMAGDDVIRGFDGDDSLFGNRGDDEISGGIGDDYIEAGLGDDLVYGGAGADVLLGFAGNDLMFGQLGDDTLKGGAGADELSGNEGDDIVQGGSGHDTLFGQAGDDAMNGGSGNDTMDGGAGNDSLFGGTGDDIMTGGTGNDLLKGNEGDDTLSGDAGNDILAGQSGNDVLNGNAGNDVIQGGSGQDVIIAGAGNDLLTGGSAADTFVFDVVAATGGGFNRITDFTDGVDLLDLTAYAYSDASTALSGASQAGADVNLALDDGQIVWLENFALADLDWSDLILSPFLA